MSRYQQVDVFGARPYAGNPVAVVFDGNELTTERMLELARWTNLSETVFLLPPTEPEADYRARIFTLAGELPFAGHPTLGSCHAWLAAGGKPANPDQIVQQCGIGLVRLRRQGAERRLAFAAPPLVRSGPIDDEHAQFLADGLGLRREDILEAAWVDNGPGWVGLLLADATKVLQVEPRFDRPPAGETLDIGLVGLYPSGAECAIEVRGLFTDDQGTLREDPVTGSLNASLAQWLLGSGRLRSPYVASQGTRLGRQGRVYIEQDDTGSVWVGGATVTCIDGNVSI